MAHKPIPVLSFSLCWAPGTNLGIILLQLEGGHTQRIQACNGAEFAAMATILNHSPVYWKTDETGGHLMTAWETVEADEEEVVASHDASF